MKTVVFQSFRTKDVPPWINICIDSVRIWAEMNNYDYNFTDDHFFEYVPDWFKRKVGYNKILLSDLARLELAKELLNKGYERTIWVDADVLIFDPELLKINIKEDFAFCKEIWTRRSVFGKFKCVHKINNSITVFVKGNDFLEKYINDCKTIVKSRRGNVGNLTIGTKYLTKHYQTNPFQLLKNVGLISPLLFNSINSGKNHQIEKYVKTFGSEIYAANLCYSYFNKNPFRLASISENILNYVIQMLLKDKGLLLNKYLKM